MLGIKKDKTVPKKPIKRDLFAWLVLFSGILWTRLFLRFRVEGLDELPEDEAFIIAANHLSYFDGLWIMAALPFRFLRRLHAIAGSDLWTDYGTLGRLMMRVGAALPLERKGSAISGILNAKRCLEQNSVLLIHPEGTRSHDGRLGTFHGGASLLSLRAQVPMIPTYIEGAYDIFSRYHKRPSCFRGFLKRRLLTIRFGKSISPEELRSSRALSTELESRLRAMEERYLNGSNLL